MGDGHRWRPAEKAESDLGKAVARQRLGEGCGGVVLDSGGTTKGEQGEEGGGGGT